MATNKNITMKQFNGTDYDTLYPKTIASQIPDVYSKTEILTADTLSKYGLTFDKLPNDVFQQIKTLIDNVQASADGKARIQTGSYVGTGTYGASNPCSLTFDLTPKFFCIAGVSDGVKITYGIAVYGSNGLQHTKPSSSTYYANLTWQENGITWYADSAYEQFNESTIGTTIYYYIAIGK